MADAKSQPEPSMEEILASIRRIISEDEQDEQKTATAKPAPAAAAPPAAKPSAPPAAAPQAPAAREPKEPEDEVLELTDRVSDDGTVVSLHPQPGTAARPARPEPAPPVASAEDIELRDMAPNGPPEQQTPEPRPEPPAGDLISAAAARAATESFAALAHAVDGRATGDPLSVGGRTLEDIVKELVRPMLREWLDANLPAVVERLVRREIERISHDAQE